MAVRSYIADQLSALGPLQKHAFSEGADAPPKRPVWIIAFDQGDARQRRRLHRRDRQHRGRTPAAGAGHPNDHQMSDTTDSLDVSFLAAATEGLDAELWVL
jgi:hypothetical protein